MRKVILGGAAMTSFGKHLNRNLRSLAEEAGAAALSDAAVGMADVGMVFFGNAAAGVVTGQEMIRGQVALRGLGLDGRPVVNVENACASGSTAAHLAWLAVASGQCDVALAVGAEKLLHEDKSITFKALATGVDQEELAAIRSKNGTQSGSVFMDIYAAKTRRYMERTGARAEDFAQIVVKSHDTAARNPLAQFRNAVSVDEVLASRPIATPLTLLMCAPNADGAAAVVLMSEEFAARRSLQKIVVRASVLVSGSADADIATGAARAAKRAYEVAGIAPSDVDVVELHDATASSEMTLYETLGLCAEGEGTSLLRSGVTSLGGRVPVNPSGGLLCRGHPIGATGCAQLVELADQLRNRAGGRQRTGARVALAENSGGQVGGDGAAAVVTILSI